MIAKEMFEKLGYRQEQNDYTITYIKNTEYIMFNLYTKEYDYVNSGIKAIPYNNQLLEAINKQVEELGGMNNGKETNNNR